MHGPTLGINVGLWKKRAQVESNARATLNAPALISAGAFGVLSILYTNEVSTDMREPISGARVESRNAGSDLLQLSTRMPARLVERLKLAAIREGVTVRELVIRILDETISDGLHIADNGSKKR